MHWTKAQKALMRLQSDELPEGQSFEAVAVTPDEVNTDWKAHGQIADVVKFLCKRKLAQADTVSLMVEAGRMSWAISELKEITGVRGRDMLASAWRAVKALKDAHGDRTVCLWLMEARGLNTTDQEALAFLLEHCASHHDLNLRLVFIGGPTMVWNNKRGCREKAVFTASGRLHPRALSLTRKGLESADETATETEELPGLNDVAEQRKPKVHALRDGTTDREV